MWQLGGFPIFLENDLLKIDKIPGLSFLWQEKKALEVQILSEVALIQVVRGKRVSLQDRKNENKPKFSYHQNMILSNILTLLKNN